MTYLVFTYNEAKRIRHVLDHAQKWADEIVVLDKGSTDGTLDICQSYGDRVRVVSIPYSDRGHEEYAANFNQHAKGDWIFFSTCSEVPTRKLIDKCKEIIAANGDKIDLIYVPRLMYYFGTTRSVENGGVAYYPFLFHKQRVIITQEIHNNFHASDPARTARIPFSEDCCVHHMTHPTVQAFWMSSLSYFAVEVQKEGDPEKLIRESFKNIEKISKRMLLEGDSWLPFYCALTSYELGKALSVWEKAQGANRGPQIYDELAKRLIAEEWTGEVAASGKAKVGNRSSRFKALKPLIVGLSQLPYLLVKMSYAVRRPKIKDE